MLRRMIIGAAAAIGLAVAVLLAIGVRATADAGVQTVDITVTPTTDTNPVGSDHTVTATVIVDGSPQAGWDVSFDVLTGPNQFDTGAGTSDQNGQVTFTYTGDGGPGTDTIEACVLGFGTPQISGQPLICKQATKSWVQPTPTPTPTPAPTATPEPTPTPTPTPATLPSTGTQPQSGSGFPWTLTAALAAGVSALVAGGAVLRRRAR